MKPLKAAESPYIGRRTVRSALCALFCAIVADGLISRFLVTGGYGSEVNPFLAPLIAGETFLPIKIAAGFLITLFLWIKYDVEPRPVYIITAVALAFYTAIVYWNLFLFLVAV
ncbi:MAG: DUF5658 family protein [Dehalococcoidia bacterium]